MLYILAIAQIDVLTIVFG